ncbi:MAG: glycine--tRNA ligase subunit beta [Pseudomonadota bacterium]
MANLLLELFSEEIPARMQARAGQDLKRLMVKGLEEAELTFDGMEAYTTPRRLTLYVKGLPAAQPDVKEERRGPRADAPEKAIQGFLGSIGVTRDDVEERETKKGTFLYALIERKGRPTEAVLADMLPDLIRGFPWPKSMRWGDASATTESLRWVRPLQSILCILDGAVVPFDVDGITVGDITFGHRFHAPDPFKVNSFDDYAEKLLEAKVILDPLKRMEQIVKEANALTLVSKVQIVRDDALVEENAGLTEWPNVLMGAFDPDFLDVPDEVLTATMRGNQKYFSLKDPQTGNLTNHFLCVANLEAEDGGKAIIAGNEKVLSARLADAKFFWEQDLKVPLAELANKLKSVTFHAKLGSVSQKVERVAKLAKWLADEYDIGQPGLNWQAAKLAKVDLASKMVTEFPSVQGVMGAYYADNQGYNSAVVKAIKEHYAPQGPDDNCPNDGVSIAVALADKMDTLAGFFAVGEKPTGSKDPYALRRAALGAIRLIVENGIRVSLTRKLIWQCLHLMDRGFIQDAQAPAHVVAKFEKITKKKWYPELNYLYFSRRGRDFGKIDGFPNVLDIQSEFGFSELGEANSLFSFLADRLKVQQREQGVRHDVIDAVFALGGQDDLVLLLSRVSALQAFLATDDGANLLAGYKRASNILRIEEKKDDRVFDDSVDENLLGDTQEHALFVALNSSNELVSKALVKEDFEAAMRALAQLRGPVDAFFDDVTVNADDPAIRENRLNLLNQIRAAVHKVADFSKIEG